MLSLVDRGAMPPALNDKRNVIKNWEFVLAHGFEATLDKLKQGN